MNDKTIERLIDALNAGEMPDRIYRARLSKNVDHAYVWLGKTSGNTLNDEPYVFYFVKNDAGIYVAAVLDMKSDLHLFVKEAHRGKTDLAKALVELILPKLFQNGRKTQSVTFQNPRIGPYCVRALGFVLKGEDSAEKDLSVYSDVPVISAVRQNITREEFKKIEIHINKAKAYLNKVKLKLELAYGGCEDVDIQFLIDDLCQLDSQIFDFIENQQGRLF